MTEKTIDFRGESTIASFFNKHNLTVFRISAGECSSHLSSKKIFLEQLDTVTEAQTWSKHRQKVIMWYLAPTNTPGMQHLHPRLRKIKDKPAERL